MFTNAIVRKPGKSFVTGLTTSKEGKPKYDLALHQHNKYIETLEYCGLDVHVLEADENYPDSVFVEDVALLTSKCAIITNPGARSRRGEITAMDVVLKQFYNSIEKITNPGTVEAGDIMMVEDHYYIGLSERTNGEGAQQMIKILKNNGYAGSIVELTEMLHLKTGVSYLENNTMIVSGEFSNHPEFKKFNRLHIEKEEAYAANSLWINGKVLVPLGYPKTKKMIELEGYEVIEVDVSEFRKLDGGLSCLSLRF